MAKNVVTLNLNNEDYSFRPYGTCSTAAGTVAKTVSITGFTLCSGATVLVKFTHGNTATSPTLNINNTGAKPIKFGNDTSPIFQNNEIYEFIYNGTNWDLIGVDNAIYESELRWGNTNIANGLSPIDTAMYSETSNNRLSFLNPDLLDIEFSRDNGVTWHTYPNSINDVKDSIPDEYEIVSNNKKIALVTDGLSSVFYLGARRSVQTADDKLRITITGDGINLYITLRKILIYYSQAYGQGNYCLLEAAQANDPDTFNIVKQYNVAGWVNWNSIPYDKSLGEFADSSRAANTRKLRLTFGVTGVTSTTATDMYVSKLRMFGPTSYAGGNNLTKTGHLYSFDSSQNVTFPANLTSTGALSANGITSTGALTVKGNTTLGDAKTDTITIKGKTTIEADAGLVLKGKSDQNPLITRSVKGSDGNGNVGPLYLQFGANNQVILGNEGKYSISSDGSQYSGKSADSTKLGDWTRNEMQYLSNANLYSIIDTTPLLANGFNLAENCTIVPAPDNDSPFKNVWLCTGHTSWSSPSNKLFYVTPGDTICVESWIMRPKDATGVDGAYYLGIQFKDKNGVSVNNNGGTVYMDHTSNWKCPCDGEWHRIYDEYTIPKSHEKYTSTDGKTVSDGGGYFAGHIRLHLNYNQGTIPTYYGGFRIYRKIDALIPTASNDEITNLF